MDVSKNRSIVKIMPRKDRIALSIQLLGLPSISNAPERQSLFDTGMTIAEDSPMNESKDTNVPAKPQGPKVEIEEGHFLSQAQVPDEASLTPIESG